MSGSEKILIPNKTYFLGETNNTIIQLFRYTIVGGFAFLLDFFALYLLTEYLFLHYLLSAAIAFGVGLTAIYFFSLLWVFNKRRLKNKKIEFGLFLFIGLIGLGLNELFIWTFTELVHFHYLMSKICTAFIVYFWNFFARKYSLFN